MNQKQEELFNRIMTPSGVRIENKQRSPELARFLSAKLHKVDLYNERLLEIDKMEISEDEKHSLIDVHDTVTIASLITYSACLQSFIEKQGLQHEYKEYLKMLDTETDREIAA